ncbi:thiamine pyrophosphate-binding protein, partial [Chloroflexota bacterium]
MDKIVLVEEGAEAFIELLNANGVDYIFMNPGTGSAAIQEALSKYKALDKKAPEVILCLHEFIAVSAAHGYFMVSGKPQVAFVHFNLGTDQVGGAVHNAQRGRAGIVMCATRVSSKIDGGRTMSLGWLHEQFDQTGAVRNYVKWDYELRSNEAIHYVVQRAFRVAATEPCGLVYLVLPKDLLGQKIEEVKIPDIKRHAASAAPHADSALMEQAAAMLIEAEEPIIMTGYSGRHHGAVGALVELAETLGARVISSQYHMNFPTTHPLFGGFGAGPQLSSADVIFIIDQDVPYVPSTANLKPDAKIIHIDIDAIKRDLPMWGFPADILVECDSSKALPLLTGIIRQKATPEDKARFKARAEKQQEQGRDIATSKS